MSDNIKEKQIRRYINEKKVSELTNISTSTLQQHRWQGKGLPYIKIGRTVRYLESEVLAYLDQLKVQKNPFKQRKPIAVVEYATALF